jgi:hypothetical protein
MRQWAVFSVAIFIVILVGVLALQMQEASAQTHLTADAGPNQTVSGPSPVLVTFQGSANVTNYTCNWYNQWALRRVTNECNPALAVNFGKKNPKPGAERTFWLEVTNTDTGERIADDVVITWTGPSVAPTQGDPADNGNVRLYGKNWGSAATAHCIVGTGWVKMEDDIVDSEGCVSSGPEDRSLVLLVGPGGWYVSDRNSGDDLEPPEQMDPGRLNPFAVRYKCMRYCLAF